MLFSQRNKLLDEGTAFTRFRNRVLNAFSDLLDIYHNLCVLTFPMSPYNAAHTLLFNIADRLGLDVDGKDPYDIYLELREELSESMEYNYVYDFIEANLTALFNHHSLSFGVQGLDIDKMQNIAAEKYNQLLKDENQPYQLYGQDLITLVNDSELA